DFVVNTIIEAARTDEKGAFGDGKIFITPILETYTVSNGLKEA
ncbi:MAG: P-II family nitrogen regulator, partial [Breznakibacter sp.]|nr:P-II family nitrogen regulator [Breznakibacter sp.]MBP8851074.1 P-II family nitrogen regulator [Breznakibacter sp.]